jgi:predicted enzyme related to lactoylglutathione lyase
MGDGEKRAPGTLIGLDLTVPDADSVRDFYASVIGWEIEPFDLGEYSDYFMKASSTGEVVSGICHARGENADLPPQWLTYVVVADLDESLRRVQAGGGSQATAIKGEAGSTRYCVIRDPAGAHIALMEVVEEA